MVYEDAWMRLRRDEIERRDGSRGTYAYVEKPDFALVIPAEDDGFHLVEEFRYPIGRRTWSFPQGGWPSGQTGSPEELARLELSQETGFRAGALARLGFLHCAHGISSQGGHYFVATELEPGPPEREREEQDMRQAWVHRARFEEMIGVGLITDAGPVGGPSPGLPVVPSPFRSTSSSASNEVRQPALKAGIRNARMSPLAG